METKKQYIAPQMMVVYIKMEKGYAASIFTTLSFWDATILSTTQQVESYTLHEDWTSSGGFWD